jgi:hypothetical protein
MLLLRLSALLTHEDFAVALFDPPRVDWTESRRAQRFSGPEIEAGVMPRTSHRIVDNEALRERTIVVGALSADRENVSATAHEQNRVLSDMAGELGAVWQFVSGNSQRQIGADWLRLLFSHSVLPRLFSPHFTTRKLFSFEYQSDRRKAG